MKDVTLKYLFFFLNLCLTHTELVFRVTKTEGAEFSRYYNSSKATKIAL